MPIVLPSPNFKDEETEEGQKGDTLDQGHTASP